MDILGALRFGSHRALPIFLQTEAAECGLASLGMVAILIPATVLGMRMGVAVLFHEGSTLLVVANALRLLAYRDRP